MTVLALKTLGALATRLSGLSGVTVLDGGPIEESPDFDVLSVGYSPEGGSARSVREPVGATNQFSETVYVACFLVCWTGDSHSAVFAALRDRMVSILDSISSLLASDSTLGGLVSEAEVDVESDTLEAYTQRGAEIMQSLVIACRRY